MNEKGTGFSIGRCPWVLSICLSLAASDSWAQTCPSGVGSPAGCTANCLNGNINTMINMALHGDRVCYSVDIFNGGVPCCDVAGVNSNLLIGDPDGPGGTGSALSVPITAGAYIARGDFLTCPSADPRCVTPGNCTIGGKSGYEYVVDHADEHGTTGNSCPPTPVIEFGGGEISAYVQGSGTLCRQIVTGASLCKSLAIFVPHGSCCEPCTGTCEAGLSCNECGDEGVFTPDGDCSVGCRLTCGDQDACTTDGACIPGSGRDNCSATPGGTPATCEPDTSFCDVPPPDFSCDDSLNCTVDLCDDTNPPLCCSYEPLCPDTVCCADGVSCDDGDACTNDTCTEGCCVHAPRCITDADCAAGDVDTCLDPCVSGCCERVDCRCGDGVVQPPEQCDDHNNIPGDGCSPTCTLEACGNNILDPGEECDGSANAACGGEFCKPDCTCGNGEIPTVSQWGLAILAMLLLIAAKLRFSHRRTA